MEQLYILDGSQRLVLEVRIFLVVQEILLILDQEPDPEGGHVLNACRNVFATL